MSSFWELAIPMMIILIPGFLFSDFKRLAHYIEKRMKRRKIYQVGCSLRVYLTELAVLNDMSRRSVARRPPNSTTALDTTARAQEPSPQNSFL